MKFMKDPFPPSLSWVFMMVVARGMSLCSPKTTTESKTAHVMLKYMAKSDHCLQSVMKTSTTAPVTTMLTRQITP